MNISKMIKNFKSKYKEGLTNDEVEALLLNFPGINKERFNAALCCVTCMVIDDVIILYRHDIEKAIRCGIENKNLALYEWD